MKLTTSKVWELDIEGINCEIKFWTTEYMKKDDYNTYPKGGIWNSYIYINKKSIPRSFHKLVPKIDTNRGRQCFRYYDLPIGMVGGTTFFDVFRQADGDIIGVKIGNDYNHIWNEHEFTNETTITKDLEETINEFAQLFPNYKVWSHVDGKYVKPENLEEYNKKANKKYFDK